MSCATGGLNSEWYHIGDLNSEIVTVSYKVPTKKGNAKFLQDETLLKPLCCPLDVYRQEDTYP